VIQRYRARISGPLMDRIDLHVEVPRLPPGALHDDTARGECTDVVRRRVVAARERQVARAGRSNGHLDAALTSATCRLERDDQRLLEHAIDTLHLSARSMHRILRVARTIADLAGSDRIETLHLTEAIGFRRLDRGLA
jgi:magnesium chelatase family protein